MCYYFEIQSPLGVFVRTTKQYWEKIVTLKHPVMKDKEDLVKKTISKPNIIHKSKIDDSVYLYYLCENSYYCCVVVRHLNNHGFIITTYRTDKIKIGDKVWPI